MLRLSGSKIAIQDSASRWVHASVASGTDAFSSHATFISRAAIAGILGLSLFPAALAAQQSVGHLDIALFATLGSPLAIAAYVSRTGQIERGKQCALLALAALIALLVGSVGGFQSVYIIAACVVPLEAVLWRCSSPLRLAAFATLVSGGILWVSNGSSSAAVLNGPADILLISALTLCYVASLIFRIRKENSIVAREQLAQRDRLALMSDHCGELITRHDANGSTVFASQAARDLLGLAPKDLLDTGLMSRVHLQDRVLFLKSISDAAQLHSKQSCQLRMRFKGDETRLWKWVEMDCNPISDKRTGTVQVVCVTRDRSQLHELEQALQQINSTSDALSESQRRFLATMSHELRTPLNAILGFSDILKQELFGSLGHEKYREYVALIQDSGGHLLNVVNDILDLSKIEAGRYELAVSTFSPCEVADATVAMLRPMADKAQVTLHCDFSTDLPDISADRRACQQILINLASNAIKFSPEGGDVRLSAKQFGRMLKIKVSDRGIGIEPASLKHVGEPFWQADSGCDRNFEGSGLGLSVVTGLVELHKGEFKIDSTPGRGTVVTVTLPMRTPASKPVPNDNTSQLVHLDPGSVQINHSTLVTSSVSKGDRRARVSA